MVKLHPAVALCLQHTSKQRRGQSSRLEMANFYCRKPALLHAVSTKNYSEIFASRTVIAKELVDALPNFKGNNIIYNLKAQLMNTVVGLYTKESERNDFDSRTVSGRWNACV